MCKHIQKKLEEESSTCTTTTWGDFIFACFLKTHWTNCTQWRWWCCLKKKKKKRKTTWLHLDCFLFAVGTLKDFTASVTWLWKGRKIRCDRRVPLPLCILYWAQYHSFVKLLLRTTVSHSFPPLDGITALLHFKLFKMKKKMLKLNTLFNLTYKSDIFFMQHLSNDIRNQASNVGTVYRFTKVWWLRMSFTCFYWDLGPIWPLLGPLIFPDHLINNKT